MGDHDREQSTLEKTRGTIKENVGKAIDNEQMEYEGKFEQGKGEAREGYANVRDDIRDKTDRD